MTERSPAHKKGLQNSGEGGVDLGDTRRKDIRSIIVQRGLDDPSTITDTFATFGPQLLAKYPKGLRGETLGKLDLYASGLGIFNHLVYPLVSQQLIADIQSGAPLISADLPLNYVLPGQSRPFRTDTSYDRFMRGLFDRINTPSQAVLQQLKETNHPLHTQLTTLFNSAQESYDEYDKQHPEHPGILPPLVPTAEGIKMGIIGNAISPLNLIVARQIAQGAPHRTPEEWAQRLLKEREIIGRADSLLRKQVSRVLPKDPILENLTEAMPLYPYSEHRGTFIEEDGTVFWVEKDPDGNLRMLDYLNASSSDKDSGRCPGIIKASSPKYMPMPLRESVPALLTYADQRAGIEQQRSVADLISTTDILMSSAIIIAEAAGVLATNHTGQK